MRCVLGGLASCHLMAGNARRACHGWPFYSSQWQAS
uniref:Uncharacterized protein n=1 Tax=Arundo donax TaxID=35708 RepID=A0A0A9F7Y7_ARUDO